MKNIMLATLIAACAVPAMAQQVYVGGSIGRAEQKFTTDGVSLSDSATGGKIFAGYELTPNFGLEGGYAIFGTGNASAQGASMSAEPKSVYLAATGTYPITPEISVFGKLGAARTRTDASASFQGQSFTAVTKHTSALIGIGASYAITPTVAVTAEYENFGKVVNDEGDSLKADLVSVGVRFKF